MLTPGIKKKIAEFEIFHRYYLDENSNVNCELPEFAKNKDKLIKMYKMMLLTRTFDTKAINLQRTGKLGTYPSNLGQEAIGVGIGMAMHEDDILFPYYREYGAQLMRGVSMHEILMHWGGCEQGHNYKNQAHDFPMCIPIASQTLHAVGAASAIKIKKQKRACVVSIGDGGTSRGDFYEAINLAGTWHLPVVFVVNNNGWAISVPRYRQTAAKTLAQKAIAGGVFAEQVDGDDVIAVTDAVKHGIDRAREYKGPTLIEAITYRLCDHTTADDASRYRDKEELTKHTLKEPINRLKKYMTNQGFWNDEKNEKLLAEINNEIKIEVDKYLNAKPELPESMFDYLYETLPEALIMQRNSLIEEREE